MEDKIQPDGVVISTKTQNNSVNSKKWNEMSYNELLEQKNVLSNRFDYYYTHNLPDVANQILKGLVEIEGIMRKF
jgi:hypothetical protein